MENNQQNPSNDEKQIKTETVLTKEGKLNASYCKMIIKLNRTQKQYLF